MAERRRKSNQSAKPPSETEPATKREPGNAPGATVDAPEDAVKTNVDRDRAFPIVGVGASAGGLEAYRHMLQALPRDAGAALVLVQHLDPTHTSLLSEILARSTSMPVREVQGELAVEPNHIYVIPPGRTMVIAGGVLRLLPREQTRSPHRPIDVFLRSLAESQRHLAVGVILSGTGNDGTQGLEAIKAEGGITFAQDETAQHDGMPRSAIAAGCADFVLPPEAIARELARIGHHLTSIPVQEDKARGESSTEKMLRRLREVTGVDFSQYRFSTLYRRISRRMLLHKIDKPTDYLRLLEQDVAEVRALYQDILISVTSFFRDPDAFGVLAAKVFPKLTRNRSRQDPVRIWVLGCSTGEEAYSLAMAFAEFTGDDAFPVQVFGTDLNEAAIEKARAGLYPRSIAQDVSPERLHRFFMETSKGGLQIRKSIREMCVFARQNVLSDPPFSRIDLLTCRNLLIYLEPTLQRRLLPLFHYSLTPNGFLWLGSSESAAGLPELFEVQDAKHKIYSKKPAAAHTPSFPIAGQRWGEPLAAEKSRRSSQPGPTVALDLQREADRLALARYAPPSVLVDATLEILQFRGDTGPYLTPAPGKPSTNLLKMAREGLLVGLRGAIQQALHEGKTVREQGLTVEANGVTRQVNLEIQPVPAGPSNERCLLVTFEEAESSARHSTVPARTAKPKPMRRDDAERRVAGLTQELTATREYLQSIVEQHEGSNEELQSANEEIQSTNEELQSVNEELQTSKEEIQSTNEELTTVNEELRNRNELLAEANADLANFLASTNLGLVVVGRDLRVRRFTSQAEKLFSLIPADVGRPIADLRLALDVKDLESNLSEVIRSEAAREEEVQDKNGQWYSLRLRPYRSLDNKVDGVVIVLVDIDAQKRAQASIEESERRFRLLADNAPVLIWVNDLTGPSYVNRTYVEFLGARESEIIGADWSKFVHPDDRAAYVSAYGAAVDHRTVFQAKFRLRRADGEYRWMNSVGVPRLGDGWGRDLVGYVGSTYDVDDLIRAQEALSVSQEALSAELAAMKRLHAMVDRILQDDSLDSILPETVDAAIEIAGADMGTVQLLERDTSKLRIAASRGLERPALDFFAHVALDDPTALGESMRRGERVTVEDVTKSDIFAGTPAFDVLRAAGVRAFQSTPLMSRSGTLIGTLSTHYRSPGLPQERDLRVLDLLARQAADAIERNGSEEMRRLDAVARYQQLVELISAGVYVVDTEGVITFHNRQTAELRGRAPTPGESEQHFWNGADHGPPSPSAATETLRSGASVRDREVEITRANGSRVNVRMNADPIRDGAGRLLGVGVVVHDVTDLKQAEAVLTDADQRKDQFIAMLAHELRNPLAALSLTIEVIRREQDHRIQDDDLAIIDRQMANLAELVDDLLDVSRIRLGKIVARRVPLDLRGVTQSSVDSVSGRFAKAGRTLTIELPPEPLNVEGNAEKLSQAITNLLDNSFRHTSEGGHTTVTLASEGADAVIRVRDTGEGISEELLPHVYELFVQGEGQRARAQGGLGIGLFLVAKIAALHGGSAGVRSDGPGKGSEFFVRIPRTAKAPAADPSPTIESNGNRSARPLRILAVEDNVDVGDQLAILLRSSGHTVRLERTGLDGIGAVAEFRPEAILLDIGLPDIDGHEAARRVRALPGFEHVVIVALTGYAVDAKERGHDAVFDEFLTKPVRPSEIEEAVLGRMTTQGK